MTSTIPLLRGDASGHYRVQVIGNSGTGKAGFFDINIDQFNKEIISVAIQRQSTLAAEVAALLGIPHISLDAVYWNPNWEPTPKSVFIDKVTALLRDSEDSHGGWVVDGSYRSHLGDLVADSATDVLYSAHQMHSQPALRCDPYCDSGLDPPLALYFPRLCLRTLKRLFGLVPPCSPNCPERVSEAFFSKDSIIWWCISHHWSVRKRESERYAVDGVEAGGKIRRLGGWGKDRDEWLRAVRAMIDGHGQ